MDALHTASITTYTGETFTPFAPDANRIRIEDIAHALSLLCRANGHFSQFFSVAQHSINCAREAGARGYTARVQLASLLHDASEAYLSDVTRPVKKLLPEYIKAETRLQDAINQKYLGAPVTDDEHAQVKQIDADMLAHEFNALMCKRVFDRIPAISGSPSFAFQPFTDVEDEFIRLFNTLKKETRP